MSQEHTRKLFAEDPAKLRWVVDDALALGETARRAEGMSVLMDLRSLRRLGDCATSLAEYVGTDGNGTDQPARLVLAELVSDLSEMTILGDSSLAATLEKARAVLNPTVPLTDSSANRPTP